ncbi:MAG: proline dehydrogenase family protein, partial [Calditrichaeota bacterium]
MGWFNKMIAVTLPYVPKPIVGFFSKQYIAGSKLEDAVRVVKMLNSNNIMATIDVLGEEVSERSHSLAAVELYKDVLEAIKTENLDANISVKPTHMGLEIDKEFCYENIMSLTQIAAENNNFVRIDIEDATTTDDTLDMYLKIKEVVPNIGTALQSYLRRTIDDVNRLIPHKANLRLCKGIYNEKREI